MLSFVSLTSLCLLTSSEAFVITNSLSPIFHNNNLVIPSLPPSLLLSDLSDVDGGMSLEEIKNYVSNIGGGLCGLPDSLKTLVGLTLNISLLLFGLLTVGYVVLGIWSFALERTIDDEIRKTPYGSNLLDAKDEMSGGSNSRMDTTTGATTSIESDSLQTRSVVGFDDDQESTSNRVQRRLKKRIK